MCEVGLLASLSGTGFRLVTEKLDEKLCVHNYRHAGIPLSCGKAQSVTGEVVESGQKQVAVSSATSGV